MGETTRATGGEAAAVERIILLATTAGNEFMLHIAELFLEGFIAANVPCELVLDEIPQDPREGELQLIVAPHEFVPLYLSHEVHGERLERMLEQAYAINVEQPGGSWFETAWEFARHCRGVLDISPDGAREIRRRGVPAHTAPLGHSKALQNGTIIRVRERPIDVLFLGHSSKRRDEFFARHADTFSRFNCHLAMADVSRPRQLNTPGYFSGTARLQLLGSSKIVLNIHSSDRTYFESHRALMAMANGCAFVTETSAPTALFSVGEHLVAAPLDELTSVCEALLSDPPSLETIACAGHHYVTTHLTMAATCARAVQWMKEAETERRQTPFVTGVHSVVTRDKQERDQIRARLTADLEARSRGERICDLMPNGSYRASQSATVSVIITLFNYGQFIEKCLASVFFSHPVPGGIEIVVVDDASTDDSLARTLAAVENADTPVVVVRKHTNTGLADARNVGLEHARGTAVFILDADNWIYPSCLRVLHTALVQQRNAAAYGLIRQFDDETNEAVGLVSKFEWNVRELVRAPYIDAMSMLDREMVQRVGGYSLELIEHGWFGWEDYDLWLKLAAAGASCTLVPNVLSSYRVHGRSMLPRTNRTAEALVRHFQRKFHGLMTEYPDLDRYFGLPLDPSRAQTHTESGPEVGLRHLSDRCNHLQTELDTMHASMSWRVTAPLRFAYRRLTGRP